ncbi:MAG: Dipeptidyl aminopeptidase/acylaminoacyl peptidase [Rhizobium sp.]|nr:Dipeptidyl aminopeptidase/acylaminoacyl peptidase [Rhizobium sp.]
MSNQKPPDVAQAAAFFDLISTEPRLTRIVDFSDAHLVIRGELPDSDSNSHLQRLMIFGLSPASTWELQNVVSGHTATSLSNGKVVYASSASDGSILWVAEGARAGQVVHRVSGNITAMARGNNSAIVYCLSRSIGAVQGPNATGPQLPGATLFTDRSASLGKVRFRAGGWQLIQLNTAEGEEPQYTDLAFEPTGEISVMDNGQILVGTVTHRDGQDGRFGFVRLAPDGKEIARYFDKTTAFSNAVSAADGATIICAGVRVADHPGGLRQRLVSFTEGNRPEELRVTDELWHRPIGFCGAHRLVTLAEDRGRRKVFLHDLREAKVELLDAPGSVLDARVINGKLAYITSSLTRMPSLRLLDIAGNSGTTRVLNARPLDLGGSAEYISQPIDKDLSLASWICRPDQPDTAGLVVIFHGGPCKTWADWPWRWNPWPFVQAGFTVLMPDPPMSLGYGNHVIDLGWKRWRTGIAKYASRQVEMVRDATGLSHKPLILMGGSFGGYLALAAAAHLKPNLVISHGAPADLQQVALTSDVTWQWVREYGAPDPFNRDYREESLHDFDKLKDSKVLLSHGFKDDLVPVSHAIGLFRRLQSDGVDTALAIFHNEHHGLTQISNQRDWFRWIIQETACAALARDWQPL